MRRYYPNEKKTLQDLELHDILVIESDDFELWTSVMKVPGGYIYRSLDKSNNMLSTVFVKEELT